MLYEDDGITLSGDTGDLTLLHNDKSFENLNLIFPNVNSILIPKKAEYNLRKYVSKKLLKQIDNNENRAIEKCLLLLAQLASTHYQEDNHLEQNRWKRLNSKILNELIGGENNTYKKVIDVLKAGTSTGAMLEVIEDDIINIQSRRYKLPDSYFKAGLAMCILQDEKILQNQNKIYYKLLKLANENPICLNLINIYPKLELPSSDELLEIGKSLAKSGKKTKKGKIYTMKNGHKREYWKNSDERSFIEDNIQMFKYLLIMRGFMIPTIGDAKSGGRIVDSFTLLPSWIRNEITIDGKKLVECDFRALHPNIAVKIYEGNQSYLTHENVAEKAGISLKDVKIEHLSFFNKTWDGMRNSPLFDYYSKYESGMLSKIYYDKEANGHKITSQKMFKIEVDIMTDVIKHLNSIGVYVLYVYDALLCEEKDKAVVVETMNRIALEHGIKTTVKNSHSEETSINEAIEEKPNTSTKDDIVYSISELKVILRDMKNHREYNGVRSAIGMLIDSIDKKTVEEANLHYWHFKNKDYLDMFKR